MSSRDKDKASGGFVNDLLRTEFHKYVARILLVFQYSQMTSCRKFMAKFIKVRSCTLLTWEIAHMHASSDSFALPGRSLFVLLSPYVISAFIFFIRSCCHLTIGALDLFVVRSLTVKAIPT